VTGVVMERDRFFFCKVGNYLLNYILMSSGMESFL